jgi:hypothetical protein
VKRVLLISDEQDPINCQRCPSFLHRVAEIRIFYWRLPTPVLAFPGWQQRGDVMTTPEAELERFIAERMDDVEDWENDSLDIIDLSEAAIINDLDGFPSDESLDWLTEDPSA